MKWDTIIEEKLVQLGHFLLGKTDEVDFVSPAPILERTASTDLRRTILSLTQSDARELGIGRSTLHYIRERARGCESLRIYDKVGRKLSMKAR